MKHHIIFVNKLQQNNKLQKNDLRSYASLKVHFNSIEYVEYASFLQKNIIVVNLYGLLLFPVLLSTYQPS